MQEIEVFQAVYADLRLPLIGADIDKLREFLRKPAKKRISSHFAASLNGLNEHRKAVLIASLRGVFSKTQMSVNTVQNLAVLGVDTECGLVGGAPIVVKEALCSRRGRDR